MSGVDSRLAGRFYFAFGALIEALGLRRSRLGRQLLAGLNIVGRLGTRIFLLSKHRPAVIDGHKMYLADHRSPSISFASDLLRGEYEQETKHLLERLIQEGMVVLDVGAHVGCYTLLAARCVGLQGRVYAFEPEPDNYAILQKNIALNRYKNIVAIRKAVSDRTGTVKLFISRQGNDRHSIFDNPSSIVPEASREVATLCLDDYLAAEGWPHVDLVKMDIEGAEPLALEGMRELLQRSEDLKLIVEFAPGALRVGGINPAKFLERLLSLGLSVSSIERAGGLKLWLPTDLSRLVRQVEGRGMINLLCQKKESTPETRPAPCRM